MTEDREAWLAARRLGIGGSDAATLVSCNPYQSLMSLYADKVGLADPQPDSPRLRWGRRLEAAILAEYSYVTGLGVADQQHAIPERMADVGGVSMLRHPDLQIAIGNADGIVLDPSGAGVIDAKTVMAHKFRGWIMDGRPPLNYLVQVTHYMECAGLDWACIAAFTGLGDDLYIYEIERDPGFAERLLEAEDTFWRRYVARRQPPPADRSEASAKALRALYPRDNGQAVMLTGPAVEWAEEYLALGAEISELKKQRDGVRTLICATIGDNTAAILPSGAGFTYKAGKAGRTLRRASARKLEKYT